jgi:hypothetical protein
MRMLTAKDPSRLTVSAIGDHLVVAVRKHGVDLGDERDVISYLTDEARYEAGDVLPLLYAAADHARARLQLRSQGKSAG